MLNHTSCFVKNAQHCSGAPISLWAFQATESALQKAQSNNHDYLSLFPSNFSKTLKYKEMGNEVRRKRKEKLNERKADEGRKKVMYKCLLSTGHVQLPVYAFEFLSLSFGEE